jgi:hypothetical protein
MVLYDREARPAVPPFIPSVSPSTARMLACQVRPSQIVVQLKPALAGRAKTNQPCCVRGVGPGDRSGEEGLPERRQMRATSRVCHDGTNERNIEMMNQCVTSRATRRRTDVGHRLIVCRCFTRGPRQSFRAE